MDFLEHYQAASMVSTPLVAIRTFDQQSAINAVRTLGFMKDRALILWDVIHGMRGLNEKGIEELSNLLDGQPIAASMPLTEMLTMAERAGKFATIFVANAHLHWTNDPAVIQGIWNLRDLFKSNGDMLVLLCHPGAMLPAELTSDVLVLDEPLPTKANIETIISDTFKFAKMDAPESDTLNKATDALLGLPSFPAEQSTAMCLDMKTKTLNVKELWSHKRQVISQTPGLSVWEGDERLDDIGGIESVKAFCSAIMKGNEPPKTIIFMDEVEKAFAGTGTDMSGVKTELTGSMLSWMQDRDIDGVIFIGLPGVSKSQLAKALGGSFGIPVVNFDIAGMQSSLVGSSGANMRAAQKTVDAISGGRILAIATCNGIDALPPELQARFQLGTFFFDAPTANERALIWDIYRTKYGIDASESLPESTGWVGREIRECCKKAYRLKMTLVEAAKYVVPVTRSSADKIAALRQSSTGKYLSASRSGVYTMTESSQSEPLKVVQPSAGRVVQFNTEE